MTPLRVRMAVLLAVTREISVLHNAMRENAAHNVEPPVDDA